MISFVDHYKGFLVNTELGGKVDGDGNSKITVSTTAPSSPSEGDIWIDTS